MPRSKMINLGLTFATLATLGACGAAQEGEFEDEEVATTRASSLCTDGAADRTVAFVEEGGFLGGISPQPTSAYDRPACSDQYVVEVTGTLGKTFDVVGAWAEPLPTTQEACPFALATVTLYSQRRGIKCQNGLCVPTLTWVQSGHTAMAGRWYPGPGFLHGCQLEPTDGGIPRVVNSPGVRVRVAVKAAALAVLFPVYKRAQAGVFSPAIPR